MSRSEGSTGPPRAPVVRVGCVVLWLLIALVAFTLNPLIGIGLVVFLFGTVHKALRVPLLVLGAVCILAGVLMVVDVLTGTQTSG